jgi:protein gp37
MADNSSIEWTESTWNPVTGCDKISPGCKHCYAERMANRLQKMGMHQYKDGFKLALQPEALKLPHKWKKPRTIFVNSMSDLFHENVPLEYIQKVFEVMNDTPYHTYQILTKRSTRMKQLAPKLKWTKNIWMGVSVENQTFAKRIDDLRLVPTAVRFLSIEPLIGPINTINLEGIDWVIVGGESGPRAREIKEEWVQVLRDICVQHGVPFFFKQWGGVNKKAAGRLLENKIWSQLPKPKIRTPEYLIK